MKQDEIIEMARQAWLDSGEGWVAYGWFSDRVNALEAFAKLVAAKEREACAKVCEEFGKTPANMSQAWRNGCLESATEIRARGEA